MLYRHILSFCTCMNWKFKTCLLTVDYTGIYTNFWDWWHHSNEELSVRKSRNSACS